MIKQMKEANKKKKKIKELQNLFRDSQPMHLNQTGNIKKELLKD